MQVNEDFRLKSLSSISIDSSHINLHPPKVFLFGGSLEEKTVRSLLYNYILVKKQNLFNSLVIVEEFKDWLHDSIYPDLLTFESDLAETSTLVVISLESAGALAELGSFSVNEKLNQKTMVIICDHHHNQDSYIKLGPLRQLKDENILSYPYVYDNLEESLNDYLEDIADCLSEFLENSKKSEKFNKESKGHIAFLIHDLVSTFKALKVREIKTYLSALGININTADLGRLLFLLEKLNLIKKKRGGRLDYYMSIDGSYRVEFSNKEDSIFDRNDATLGAMAYYNTSKKEKVRLKVLEASLEEEV